MTILQDPWGDLPTNPPYVLPCDKPILDQFSPKLIGDTAVRLDTLAYPYLGNPKTADVLLLALNGGFAPEVLNYLSDDPVYVDQRRKSLTFESDYPFFYLDPRFSYTLGYRWWRKRLSYFIERQGQKAVANQFACIQFFPYCSARYKELPKILPSQEYSFGLVRQAIKDKKEIVLMRSRAMWLAAVPELKDYPYIELRFPRNPYIDRKHMTEEQFARIENAVKV
ncbi:MAG: hypothetical protein ACRYFS_05985 [Janthinobacterium lividum]